MGQSDIFKKAEHEKTVSEDKQRSEIAENNKRLEELYLELQRMQEDLKSYSIAFAWGVNRFSSQKRAIFLTSRKGSNAIIVSNADYEAYGSYRTQRTLESSRFPGVDEYVNTGDDYSDYTYEYRSEKIGNNAQEAAEAIASSLVKTGTLPVPCDVANSGWTASWRPRSGPDFFERVEPYLPPAWMGPGLIVLVIAVLLFIFL